ncbi:SRPBCC family protein [Arthrobacter sp. NPDC057009]|uniref:SRPBCC family protein n=1 Tax=Arthrobacter sp. NPDC057009 TaxID=3345996 RepID=UPI00362D006C
MITVSGTVGSTLPARTAFAYLSAFEHTSEWDPGTPVMDKLTEGPVAVGHRYHAEAVFRGKRQPIEYEVVELFDNHIKLRGEHRNLVAFDSIDVRSLSSGSEVVYNAQFRINWPYKLLQPFLTPQFMKLRNPALNGLRQKLESL